MRRKILIGLLIAALVGVVVMVLVLAQQTHPSADIVAGSSLITDIIQDISDGKLKAYTVISPGMCPGNYDVKPSDVETLTNSRVLIIHNWQQNMKTKKKP